MINPNHRGDVAEAAITLEAIRQGLEVFRPAADHSRADLIFGQANDLYRIQCKTARKQGEVLTINLVGSRHTPGGYVRSWYTADEIDLVAAYCHELDRSYLLPFSLIDGKSAIQLRLSPPRNCQRAAIHFAANYEFSGAVAQLGERRRGTAEATGSSPVSSTPVPPAGATTIGAHELRERFGYWMERANAGDNVLVTRHGRPFVRLAPPHPTLLDEVV